MAGGSLSSYSDRIRAGSKSTFAGKQSERAAAIVGVNLNGARRMGSETCPPIIKTLGQSFVPFAIHY